MKLASVCSRNIIFNYRKIIYAAAHSNYRKLISVLQPVYFVKLAVNIISQRTKRLLSFSSKQKLFSHVYGPDRYTCSCQRLSVIYQYYLGASAACVYYYTILYIKRTGHAKKIIFGLLLAFYHSHDYSGLILNLFYELLAVARFPDCCCRHSDNVISIIFFHNFFELTKRRDSPVYSFRLEIPVQVHTLAQPRHITAPFYISMRSGFFINFNYIHSYRIRAQIYYCQNHFYPPSYANIKFNSYLVHHKNFSGGLCRS